MLGLEYDREATTEKSPLAQVFCCRYFTAAKSGARLGVASTTRLMNLTSRFPESGR
jgi:hypothetical protein